MGSKKKKLKDVKEKKKSKEKVEERLKQIMNIQPPDDNPWKMENEQNIDRFWRYRGKNPEKLSRRELFRMTKK